MESIGEDLLREILVKLPTIDVARSSCVSRLWRIVVRDPSFRRLHGKAAHVVGGAVATLLITEIRPALKVLDMNVLNASLAKPLCRVTGLASGYEPVNACNGFILFSHVSEDCPYVCNPITGEKLKIPPPPLPPTNIESVRRSLYTMGFSPSTCQYKLFRLSVRVRPVTHGGLDYDFDVCTLGNEGNGGWRRHPRPPPDAIFSLQSPVYMDGKLYVLIFHRILVIDVASETHYTYRLPEFMAGKQIVHAFDLDGRLCIAQHVLDNRRLNFWVMPPLQSRQQVDDGNMKLAWELVYCFYMDEDDDGNGDLNRPRGAWLNNDNGMLCYRQGDRLYMYDTSTESKQPTGCFSEWNHRIRLPATPQPEKLRWNVYGGYRPSLLSPRCLEPASAPLPQHCDEQENFEDALLHALQYQQPAKKRFSTCAADRVNNATHTEFFYEQSLPTGRGSAARLERLQRWFQGFSSKFHHRLPRRFYEPTR